jgi:hypothetical protein
MEHVAYLAEPLLCSECGSTLSNHSVPGKRRIVYCVTPSCSLCEQGFFAPSVRLEPADPFGRPVKVKVEEKPPSRFAAFNPDEREIMRVLLQEHGNTVAQIALSAETHMGAYIMVLEELEREINEA